MLIAKMAFNMGILLCVVSCTTHGTTEEQLSNIYYIYNPAIYTDYGYTSEPHARPADSIQEGSHYTTEKPTVKLPITSHFSSINDRVFRYYESTCLPVWQGDSSM
jgi:hypothetical protein